MPRQSNGNYIQPANTAAVSGQAISSTSNNTLITDIGTEITNSVDRGGRAAMQAALPMGGQKITGMADPTVSTDAATKAYADALVAAFFSTGDVKLTIKTVADTGWVMFDDGTIGSASSGSSNRANADTQALFTLLFNNISDTYSPILTSGGGATTRAAQSSASAAWAANCRISLTKTLGRALGIAGSGSGLTARTLGQTNGLETATLLTANLPPYTPAGSVSTSYTAPFGLAFLLANGTSSAQGGGATISGASPGNTVQTITPTGTLTGTAQGGTSTPVAIMPPEVFLNAMIKL